MKSHLRFSTLRMVTTLAAAQISFAACSYENGKPTDPGYQTGAGTTGGADARQTILNIAIPSLVRGSIDPNTLAMSSLSVIRQKMKDGTIAGHVYLGAPGQADYVELKISYLGSDGFAAENLVPEKVIRNRFLMKSFPKGTVVVQARPCVEASRTTQANVFCGLPMTENFQSENVDQGLLDRQNELQRKKAELAQLNAELVNQLNSISQSLAQCNTDRASAEQASAMSALVKTFLSAGSSNVGEFFKPSSMVSSTDATGLIASTALSQLASPIQNIMSSLSSSVSSGLSSIATSVPLFANSANPVAAMTTFGGALFDLFASDNAIPKGCGAMTATSAGFQNFFVRVKDLNDEINTLAASVVPQAGAK